MTNQQISITKASGQKVPFSEEKLRTSLERSGAIGPHIDAVVEKVNNLLYDGISTKMIYMNAYDILRNRTKSSAARYKLKRAVMELGPSGYPFEKFVGAIFDQQGYMTQVGVIIKGRCVQHEIDVLASKNGKQVMVECKFHNRPGVKCDVKVPLYIHSRFQDIVANSPVEGKALNSNYEGWIVTNTRFTEDAISFGVCSNIMMVGWDYPSAGNLKERIELSGLHPVTCLSSLNHKAKKMLLDKGVVLCRNIAENLDLLRLEGFSEGKIRSVLFECSELVTEIELPPRLMADK